MLSARLLTNRRQKKSCSKSGISSSKLKKLYAFIVTFQDWLNLLPEWPPVKKPEASSKPSHLLTFILLFMVLLAQIIRLTI